MKLPSPCLLYLSAACLFSAACRLPHQGPSHSGPRVVRVLATNNTAIYRLSINGGPQDAISHAELHDRFTALALGYGDLVLCEKAVGLQSNEATDSFRWLLGLCSSNRVSFYVCSSDDVKERDIFSIPVYHWVAPYSTPTEMDGAAFFLEGSPLGKGTNGFRNMLSELEHSCPRQVFILGSAIRPTYEGPPDPSPYISLKAELNKVLQKCGTQRLILDEESSMPP